MPRSRRSTASPVSSTSYATITRTASSPGARPSSAEGPITDHADGRGLPSLRPSFSFGLARRVERPSGVAFAEERGHHGQHFVDIVLRQTADEFGMPRPPVQALHLIRQDDADNGETFGDRNFERISLDATGDRATQGQANPAVVRRWGQHKRWTTPGLLVSSLWREREPDDVATMRDIAAWHYHASRPTAGPVRVSPCRFRFVTRRRRSLRRARRGATGAATKRPFEIEMSTTVPSPTPTSSANGLGILRARLLPHF